MIKMKMKSFIYIGVISLAILIISCGIGFASEDSTENNINLNIIGILPFSDAVEVKDVDAKATVSNNLKKSEAHGIKIKLEIVPKEDIDHIKSMELQNVEITYNNGTKVQLENRVFKYDSSDLDNKYFKTLKRLDKDYDYLFTYHSPVSYYDANRVDINPDAPYKITHIKGEIVVNTTTEDNRVIGHLDSDIKIT